MAFSWADAKARNIVNVEGVGIVGVGQFIEVESLRENAEGVLEPCKVILVVNGFRSRGGSPLSIFGYYWNEKKRIWRGQAEITHNRLVVVPTPDDVQFPGNWPYYPYNGPGGMKEEPLPEAMRDFLTA